MERDLHKSNTNLDNDICFGGKFKISRVLGEGGFGTVYLVEDTDTIHLYALKIIKGTLLNNKNAHEMFKKELLIWVNLGLHPFILPAYWVDYQSGNLFVLSEYIQPDKEKRLTLSDYLSYEHEAISYDQGLKWAIQFCLGMQYANRHGVKVHKDIKPNNILITKDRVLKIADFGLAVASENTCEGIQVLSSKSRNSNPKFIVSNSNSHKCCGTLGYMPPEICSGEFGDVRSDIYSFGVVLWQIISNCPISPFLLDVKYTEDIISVQKELLARQLACVVPTTGREAEDAIIRKCLMIEPSKRYGDFEQLKKDLESIYKELTGAYVEVPEHGLLSPKYLSNKGGSLKALGKYKEAITYFDKALDDAPDLHEAWIGKGACLSSLGNHEEAVQCYDNILQSHPNSAMAWHNKGGALHSMELYKEAVGCFEKTLEIDPNFSSAWYGMGCCYRSLAQYWGGGELYCKALKCFDEALKVDSTFIGAYNNKADIFNVFENYPEAIKCCDQGLKVNPLNESLLILKGEALLMMQSYEKAHGFFMRALEINPASIGYYYKGICEEKMHMPSEALLSFKKFIELAPSNQNQAIEHAETMISELCRRIGDIK